MTNTDYQKAIEDFLAYMRETAGLYCSKTASYKIEKHKIDPLLEALQDSQAVETIILKAEQAEAFVKALGSAPAKKYKIPESKMCSPAYYNPCDNCKTEIDCHYCRMRQLIDIDDNFKDKISRLSDIEHSYEGLKEDYEKLYDENGDLEGCLDEVSSVLYDIKETLERDISDEEKLDAIRSLL